MIDSVRQIVLPVDDQDAAVDFWVNVMGFRLETDESYGEGDRWIEVAMPTGGIRLVLSKRDPDDPRPIVRDELPHSPVFFSCADIRTTHAELVAKGVHFPTPPTQMPFGWWALFEDRDGTRYALGQR